MCTCAQVKSIREKWLQIFTNHIPERLKVSVVFMFKSKNLFFFFNLCRFIGLFCRFTGELTCPKRRQR